MEQDIPTALQVALYAASAATIVMAAVCVHVLLRAKVQLDRLVNSVEHVEAEITPLIRDVRVPLGAISLTSRILRTGTTTFLRTLWTGRRSTGRETRLS